MVKKHVSCISVATSTISTSVAARVFAVLRAVVAPIGGWSTAERHPGHVNLARIAVAFTRIKLVEHAYLMAAGWSPFNGDYKD